ncbi:MAG TPA: hypothetical protein VMW27_20730, partial [Thermoanaerobaculia bacterium]|nr:hypothetical protein [Thermoanaerobaculia bacterium]
LQFNHDKSRFEYYADVHDQLQSKIDILEDYDFVRVVKSGESWNIYRMTNDFVQKVLGYDWNNAA